MSDRPVLSTMSRWSLSTEWQIKVLKDEITCKQGGGLDLSFFFSFSIFLVLCFHYSSHYLRNLCTRTRKVSGFYWVIDILTFLWNRLNRFYWLHCPWIWLWWGFLFCFVVLVGFFFVVWVSLGLCVQGFFFLFGCGLVFIIVLCISNQSEETSMCFCSWEFI